MIKMGKKRDFTDLSLQEVNWIIVFYNWADGLQQQNWGYNLHRLKKQQQKKTGQMLPGLMNIDLAQLTLKYVGKVHVHPALYR